MCEKKRESKIRESTIIGMENKEINTFRRIVKSTYSSLPLPADRDPPLFSDEG